MGEKVVIGGKPLFENAFSNCTFLGRHLGYDLYVYAAPDKEPQVIARSGDESGDYIEGLKSSYGSNPALTAARRIAEFKGLLSIDPVKTLLHAWQIEDLNRLTKTLPNTPEYAALSYFEAGDLEKTRATLDYLLKAPYLTDLYGSDIAERMRHVDMRLHLIARFFKSIFSENTCKDLMSDKFSQLGVPRTFADALNQR